RGAAANHQDVDFSEDRNLTRRLRDRFRRTGAVHLASSAEQFNAMSGADAAAVIATARRSAKNLALPRRSFLRPLVFAVCHAWLRNSRFRAIRQFLRLSVRSRPFSLLNSIND